MDRSPQIASGLITLAGFGLLVASGKQSDKQGALVDSTVSLLPKNKQLSHNKVRALVYRLFPEARNNNVALKIIPFRATVDELEGGNTSRAIVYFDATSVKLRINLHYWVEGTPEDVLKHEIGHMIDVYDLWAKDPDAYDRHEYEPIDFKALARNVCPGIVKRYTRGERMVIETSAWAAVRHDTTDHSYEKLALDTYRLDRNSTRTAHIGLGVLMAGVASLAYSLTSQKKNKT